MDLNKFYNKKKILITGHTGFKGSWLVHWLSRYNVKILGIGLNPYDELSLFKYINKKKLIDKRLDITNYKKLEQCILKFKPDIIYHLAAQALVKKSVINPLETFNTNIIGTANVLNCINKLNKKTTSVIITSDKCYENLNLVRGYYEEDRLGGHDPYSASKASAEIVFKSFFKTILQNNNNVSIASARAGNVIGGGDWSKDRLIPDCFKFWSKGKFSMIRNPNSTRPWQHVIEVVYGYILLAKKLDDNPKLHGEVFNFGPSYKKNYKVIEILKYLNFYWKKCKWKIKKSKTNQKESVLLKLNSSKANKILKWKTTLSFKESLTYTLNWYKEYYSKKSKLITFEQINSYKKNLKI